MASLQGDVAESLGFALTKPRLRELRRKKRLPRRSQFGVNELSNLVLRTGSSPAHNLQIRSIDCALTINWPRRANFPP